MIEERLEGLLSDLSPEVLLSAVYVHRYLLMLAARDHYSQHPSVVNLINKNKCLSDVQDVEEYLDELGLSVNDVVIGLKMSTDIVADRES